jgi:shikimate 5-dehydrogenase
MNPPHDGPAGTRRVLALDQVEAWQGQPLILFVGIDTCGSLVHTVFDRWAALLERPWTLRGLDMPAATPPETYRRLMSMMRDNPAVDGAVITAHKLRLFRACAPELTRRDWLTDATHEVNTLATGQTVDGYARDALSLTRILPLLPVPIDGLNVLCLGAGGAATALLLALHLDLATGTAARSQQPARVVFTDTDPRALDALRTVASRARIAPDRLAYVPVSDPRDTDALLADLPAPALVVNATGLGKDAPGSPLTDRAPFHPSILAWDLNYRGALTFLRQATNGGAATVDGWDYFVAGWAGGLTAIAQTPFTDDLLSRFAQAAAPHRPSATDR